MPHLGNAYSAEIGANEWRVIVPRRGKLTPFVSPQRFLNERDARQWMESDEGEALIQAQSGANRGRRDGIPPDRKLRRNALKSLISRPDNRAARRNSRPHEVKNRRAGGADATGPNRLVSP